MVMIFKLPILRIKCRVGRNYHDYEVYMEKYPDTAVVQMDSVIGSKGGKVLLNGKSPYEAFCFYYGEELAQKLGCHKVGANDINLTPGLLKK